MIYHTRNNVLFCKRVGHCCQLVRCSFVHHREMQQSCCVYHFWDKSLKLTGSFCEHDVNGKRKWGHLLRWKLMSDLIRLKHEVFNGGDCQRRDQFNWFLWWEDIVLVLTSVHIVQLKYSLSLSLNACTGCFDYNLKSLIKAEESHHSRSAEEIGICLKDKKKTITTTVCCFQFCLQSI